MATKSIFHKNSMLGKILLHDANFRQNANVGGTLANMFMTLVESQAGGPKKVAEALTARRIKKELVSTLEKDNVLENIKLADRIIMKGTKSNKEGVTRGKALAKLMGIRLESFEGATPISRPQIAKVLGLAFSVAEQSEINDKTIVKESPSKFIELVKNNIVAESALGDDIDSAVADIARPGKDKGKVSKESMKLMLQFSTEDDTKTLQSAGDITLQELPAELQASLGMVKERVTETLEPQRAVEEMAVTRRKEIKKAQEIQARGEMPAQGAGSTPSLESFMGNRGQSALEFAQKATAKGPAGGVLPPGTMRTPEERQRTFNALMAEGQRIIQKDDQRQQVGMSNPLFNTGQLGPGKLSLLEPLEQPNVPVSAAEQELRERARVFNARVAAFQGAFEEEEPIGPRMRTRVDPIDPLEDPNEPVIPDVEDAETLSGAAPAGAGAGTGGGGGAAAGGGAAGGGAGTGGGANAGGGAGGPDDRRLRRDERDARLARMIAEQNTKLAVEILKSQRKKGLKPFLSTEDMNEITYARNLDARQMKAENLFKDYQNANAQELQRLIELQRHYNDMYRVPIAK